MKAAVLNEYGTPVYGDFDEPRAGAGAEVIRILAAGVNPADLKISAGEFGPLKMPCVAGREAIAELDGRRIYFNGAVAPHGSMAERSLVDPAGVFEVPEGIDEASALAIGIAGYTAWTALSWRARLQPGEHVLVLGASGMVGMIAVQAARLLGAGRIVAAARSEQRLTEARRRGAHATVTLDRSGKELTSALREASGGRLDVIIDPVWGEPALAALHAATKGGRLVQIGTSAGGEIALNPGFMLGSLISILGFSSSAVPRADLAAAYARMCRHVIDGELKVETQELPLSQVAEAWQRQKASPHAKLVLRP
jgi:NADPH2:quinone reductase